MHVFFPMWILLNLASLAVATCRLPAELPPDTSLSSAAAGPSGDLLLASTSGAVLFVDLHDFAVRVDRTAGAYKEHYGAFDIQGMAMVDPNSSTFLYIGISNKPVILEYEWRRTHKVYRQFNLHGLGSAGMRSLTFVPTDVSLHVGYFYVGDRATGNILVYELPLLDKTGLEAQAVLKDTWTVAEAKGSRHATGMSFSDGYLFLSYDEEESCHILIFSILPNGLHGPLAEQYQVDVVNAQGLVARKETKDTWEIYLASAQQRAVFAYRFRFVTGFDLHGHCGTKPREGGTPSAACPALVRWPLVVAAVLVTMVLA